MTDQTPSAYELFTRFAPKFREVKWKGGSFASRDENFLFYVQFAGKEGSRYSYNSYSAIDLKQANMPFTCIYDPVSSLTPRQQVFEAVFQAIMAGPFAGRTFYMDPLEMDVEPFFASIAKSNYNRQIRVAFSYDGEVIPGLTLMSDICAEHWTFFVPKNSAEGKAIEAAVHLEQAVERQKKLRESENTFPSVHDLQGKLGEALAALNA